MNGLGQCARCGRNPAQGWARINGKWYCHPDFGPSCYMEESFDMATGGAGWEVAWEFSGNNQVTQNRKNSQENDKGSRLGASNRQ